MTTIPIVFDAVTFVVVVVVVIFDHSGLGCGARRHCYSLFNKCCCCSQPSGAARPKSARAECVKVGGTHTHTHTHTHTSEQEEDLCLHWCACFFTLSCADDNGRTAAYTRHGKTASRVVPGLETLSLSLCLTCLGENQGGTNRTNGNNTTTIVARLRRFHTYCNCTYYCCFGLW
jgi:hypothetical protein